MLTTIAAAMLTQPATIQAAASDTGVQQTKADPRREFDFWVGEWSVQNRNLLDDGTWEDRTVTRARITPVCDGSAILEEWAGPFNDTFMNGFSLRAWNAPQEHWDLLLFWTTTGDGGFGTLTGNFRHGRGEFFSSWKDDGTNVTQRYSFSDGLPNSVRWDSAITRDGGQTWRTDWIMEFSRTRAADETTQDRLFEVDWTEGELSTHDEARALDWMLGEWAGTQTVNNPENLDETRTLETRTLETRLRCKLLIKDCLILDILETREAGSDDWNESLSVRAYTSRENRWESWHVSEDDPTLHRRRAEIDGDTATFERFDPTTGVTLRETVTHMGEGRLVIERGVRSSTQSSFVVVTRSVLRRAG